MKGRMRQQPEHESPHEARIVWAVGVAGVSDEQRPFYLCFARELERSLCRRLGPDYSSWTKRIVEKWFIRGLNGHKMWLIGQALQRDIGAWNELSEGPS